jgi:hypothetical protein
MKIIDIKIEGMVVSVLVLGIKLLEHECGDDMELQKMKNMRKQYIRDIDSKGNIVDEEV